MRTWGALGWGTLGPGLVLLAAVALPRAAQAQWHATVGAQSKDLAKQALAFLPNEIWIHAGDSVTWSFQTDEIHTVTFLTAGQVRPPFAVGCPGFATSPATFDGTTCVTTAAQVKGASFTVTFPNPGNFKLVCLVHETMTGVVHVLDASATLPYDQAFYDREAARQQQALLTDDLAMPGMDEWKSYGDHDGDHDGDRGYKAESPGAPQVTAGIGEINATPGGAQTLSVMRFSRGTITVHVGDTVEWSNSDPITPHTITFGTEPTNLLAPSANVTAGADGALHATIHSMSDNVSSGFLMAAPQERIGLAQAPPGVTRFEVTFTHTGVYPYICALHDTLGMKGEVIVVP